MNPRDAFEMKQWKEVLEERDAMRSMNENYGSIAPKPECKHQFFEIKKIRKYSDNAQKQADERKDLFETLHYLPEKGIDGIRVICALCREVKDLYEEEK